MDETEVVHADWRQVSEDASTEEPKHTCASDLGWKMDWRISLRHLNQDERAQEELHPSNFLTWKGKGLG